MLQNSSSSHPNPTISNRYTHNIIVLLVLLVFLTLGGVVSMGNHPGQLSQWPLHLEGNNRIRLPQEFLDQVDMCHDHAAAAISSQGKLVHRVPMNACRDAGQRMHRDFVTRLRNVQPKVTYPSVVPSSKSLR